MLKNAIKIMVAAATCLVLAHDGGARSCGGNSSRDRTPPRQEHHQHLQKKLKCPKTGKMHVIECELCGNEFKCVKAKNGRHVWACVDCGKKIPFHKPFKKSNKFKKNKRYDRYDR
jgi:transcription elongation factor Elf1